MDGSREINAFFSNRQTQFIIPLYQRKYAWRKEHCKRLLDDLRKVHSEGRASHFFGTIVYMKTSGTDQSLIIIDGQQRLTTISLLILAGLHAVEKGDMEPGDIDKDGIKTDFLLAPHIRGERKIKLVPIDDDRQAYDALLQGDETQFVKTSSMTINYRYFYDLLKADQLTFTDLYYAICKLCIIEICLRSEDDPQLIFESLNSCGKDLEEADKVRNYLLMNLDGETQKNYYNDYWKPIEQLTGGDPSMFIRDYLTIKRKRIPKLDDLYFDFKDYDAECALCRRDLLADLLKYARYYKRIASPPSLTPATSRLERQLWQLSNLGSLVHAPFLMEMLNYADENNWSDETRGEILSVVESFWARRIICGVAANAMARIFASLHYDTLRMMQKGDCDYPNTLKYVLLQKEGTSRFPKDDELRNEFAARDIYKIPRDYRCFLFERMENGNSLEAHDDVAGKIKGGQYTIEHIMPQSLTPQWRTELGDDWAEIHLKYLNTFANLTLTAYNSSYGNKPFLTKKQGFTKNGKKVPGFNESGFHLSEYIKTCEHWGLKELEERGRLLLAKFMELWPMLTSTYVAQEGSYDILSLDSIDEGSTLTGRAIAAFTYNGARYQVGSWKEMLTSLCMLLYQEDSGTMLRIASQGNGLDTHARRYYSMVTDGLYVWTGCDTRAKIATIGNIFEECDIEPELLEFELRPSSLTAGQMDFDAEIE